MISAYNTAGSPNVPFAAETLLAGTRVSGQRLSMAQTSVYHVRHCLLDHTANKKKHYYYRWPKNRVKTLEGKGIGALQPIVK